jgi:dihydroxyacid dehydratase/phosphogluconate dehydratase
MQDLSRLFIVIASSQTDIVPGRVLLHEFSSIAVDDGTVMGDPGTRYSLSSADEEAILSRCTGFSQGDT